MRVLKFGGSSVTSASAIRQVLQIISKKHQDEDIHVVVSALQGITNQLEEIAVKASQGGTDFRVPLGEVEDRHISIVRNLVSVEQQSSVITELKLLFNKLDDVLHGVSLTRELTDRIHDFILSFGERLAAAVITQALREMEILARYVDARNLIITDHQFGHARVDIKPSYQNIREHLSSSEKVSIITGFIASDGDGVTTTLGRGGSDYTAALIGAALEAEAIEKWSDVEGIMTADPEMVSQHLPILELSYEEAMELSHFGASVMYPPTLQPAMEYDIPIHIKDTFNPDKEGTVIKKEVGHGSSRVKGVSSIDHVSLITLKGSGMVGVSGIAARIFSALAHAKVNIILITQASSEHTVCFAVLPAQAERALNVLHADFKQELQEGDIDEVRHEPDCSIVAAVGDGMKRKPGISGQLFRSLGRNGINVRAIAQGSSERNISVVVKEYDLAKTLNTIHDAFFLSKIKSVNLFLIGVGLIGNKLLELFEQQADLLYDKYNIKLNLCGIANSRHYKVSEDGFDFIGWPDNLENGHEMVFDNFMKEARAFNLPNSLVVDCTASSDISERYTDILESGFSLVTANKKANSGPMDRYQELQELALNNNVMYLYETNVGAGLPVVKTLKEQVLAGDKITKIEGVLSGTLSYIFNVYDGKKPFSQVVRTALEKGFTEPDPREDLNGKDVARKLLILAREAGLELEIDDLSVENLVPEPAMQAQDIDSFFTELAQYDEQFKQRYDAADAEGNRLSYIARYEDGDATVGLQSISEDHPFSALSGSDNIIAFHTRYYRHTPLVVKGPGAGAEVTASGILADILRISNVPAFSNENI